MALSVSDRPWRKWALRSMAGFLLVYMAGAFGVPTLILYVVVLLAVVVGAGRLAIQNRRADDLLRPRRGKQMPDVKRSTDSTTGSVSPLA